MVEALVSKTGLSAGSQVADVGSGTGISTELFLQLGATVYAVEPNADMRAAAEQRLSLLPGFHSMNGSAEDTTLPDSSVDLVTCAQAFHWFDPTASGSEFRRILRPQGWIALFWNSMRKSDPFLAAYEELLVRFGTDYQAVANSYSKGFEDLFDSGYSRLVFPNQQVLDFEGAARRLASSSYVPPRGDQKFDSMMDALRDVFETHQHLGSVTFEYDTELYLGQGR